MTRMRRPAPAVVGAVVALLLTWLLALAAGAGPQAVVAPAAAPIPSPVSIPDATERGSDLPMRDAGDEDAGMPPLVESAYTVTVPLVIITVVLLVVAILGVVATVLWWRGREPDDDDESPQPQPVIGTEPHVTEVEAEGYRSALVTGTPRNGIVACWVELERVLAKAGTPAAPSDSPTEFVTRALREHAVPEDAITALAAAYREARFSRHHLGENDRDDAARALAIVDAALRGRTA